MAPILRIRGTILKTIGGGLTSGVASAAPASAQPDGLSHQLNEVRAVTRKHRDIETARDDGYADISGYVPEMGSTSPMGRHSGRI